MGLQRFQLWITSNETATNVMHLPTAISSRAVFSEYDQKPGWLMRFCNGIPNDRYRIVADENRWPAGSASPFRDRRGVQRLPSRCCGARLARPPLPPGPLPLPHGERKGGRGWCERMVARARNGRRCTVRASCNIRVFDQALRNPPLPLPGTRMNADRGTQLQASVPRCVPGCAPGCAGLRPACAMSRGNLSADASATITYQVPVPQLLMLAG